MGKPAATIGSLHVCPKTTGTVPHVGGPIVAGSGSVKLNLANHKYHYLIHLITTVSHVVFAELICAAKINTQQNPLNIAASGLLSEALPRFSF